jgi:hypothetical protein
MLVYSYGIQSFLCNFPPHLLVYHFSAVFLIWYSVMSQSLLGSLSQFAFIQAMIIILFSYPLFAVCWC